MSEVTRDGGALIKQWLDAQGAVECAKSALNNAECREMNAERALGKWLMPDDMKIGEKIAVWQGCSLFQVERFATGPKVSIRTRGKGFENLRHS